MISKEGDKIATVFGTLILDTGEKAKTQSGDDRLDEEGETIPVLDNIDFITPVNSSKELKAVIQALAIEALTLKDMEVAKKNGQLSHFVQAIKKLDPRNKVIRKKK